MLPRRTATQNALVLGLWGMALGLWLWASGLDIALQGWLWANYNQTFNNNMRFLSQLSLGRTQIWGLIFIGGGVALWHGGLWGFWRLLNATGQQFLHWLKGHLGWLPLWAGVPTLSRLTYTAMGVLTVSGVLQIISKFIVGRPRPKEWLWNSENPFTAQPFGLDSLYWSLPSGHTTSTFAIFCWLALGLPQWRVPLLLAAVILSCSRFLAVTPHYLGDVVAGAGLGAAVAVWLWGRARG
jgi:membrane-associated phospholipid phosphatase